MTSPLGPTPPSRQNAHRARCLARLGLSPRAIHRHPDTSIGPKFAKMIHRDVDSGTHWWDPVDDPVAIQRFLDMDTTVWPRMTPWERREALRALYEAGPEWEDWGECAKAIGYRDVESLRNAAFNAATTRTS